MGGGQSTESPVTEPVPTEPSVHTESWYTKMTYENSTMVSEALSSCYGSLEAAWSSRSGNYKLVSETKLRHSLSSCKSFLNLAIHRELSVCEDNGEYWYTVNMASSATSTVLFIVMTILIAKLRRSNKVKSRMKRHLPERFFDPKKSHGSTGHGQWSPHQVQLSQLQLQQVQLSQPRLHRTRTIITY